MQGGRHEGRASGGGGNNSRSISQTVGVHDDAGGRVLGYGLMACSGAIVGFLLSGSLSLGLFSLLSLIVGAVIGWVARGVVS